MVPISAYTDGIMVRIFGKGKEKIPAMPGSPKHEILNSKQIQITEIKNSKRDCFVAALLAMTR